ncbi:hypothetical protein E4U54_001361 [Claviceps lovelessii]|nr:hypothetical protein E4U54_001361 [Claviceps lovelessii]
MCEQAVANNWSVSPLSSLSSQLIVVHRRSPLDLLALTGLVAVAGADADADADVKDFSSRPALAASPSAAAMSSQSATPVNKNRESAPKSHLGHDSPPPRPSVLRFPGANVQMYDEVSTLEHRWLRMEATDNMRVVQLVHLRVAPLFLRAHVTNS